MRCAAVGLLAAVGAWLKLTVAIMLIAVLIDAALGMARGGRVEAGGLCACGLCRAVRGPFRCGAARGLAAKV